jgi:hypothetical protein
MLVRARQQAGAIDRALRAEQQAVPGLASVPGKRYEHRVAAANADRARTLVADSTTSPDGVTTYRFRIGSKVYCRRTGAVGPDMGRSAGAILAGAGSAGDPTNAGLVECPSGEREWERR